MAEIVREPETVTIPRRHQDRSVDGAAESIRQELFNKLAGEAPREVEVTRSKVEDLFSEEGGRKFRQGDHPVFGHLVRRQVLEETGLLTAEERALRFDDQGHFDVGYDGKVQPIYKSRINASHFTDLTRLINRARILANSMGGETETSDIYLKGPLESGMRELQRYAPHFFRPDGTPKGPIEPMIIPRIRREHDDPIVEYRKRLRLATEALKALCNYPDREMKCDANTSFVAEMNINPFMAERILQMHKDQRMIFAVPLAFHAMDIHGDQTRDDYSVAPEMAERYLSFLNRKKMAPLDPLTMTMLMYQHLENLLPGSPRFVAFGEKENAEGREKAFTIAADDDIVDFLRGVEIGFGGPFHEHNHDPALGVVFLPSK